MVNLDFLIKSSFASWFFHLIIKAKQPGGGQKKTKEAISKAAQAKKGGKKVND